jgi:hypothetical protein
MWLFRLPAIVYLILAPLGVAGSVYLYIDDQKSEAAKAVARAAPPPAEVKIEAFDRAHNTGTANEVVVLGQVDVTQAMEVTRSKSGTVRERWVIAPVYPTTATDPSAPAIGVMLQRGAATDDQLAHLVVAQGKFAPIMRLDGSLLEPGSERQALDEVTDRMKISPSAIYIDPFEEGRAAGLAASNGGRDAAIAALVISLLIGAFGAFRFFSERNPKDGYM